MRIGIIASTGHHLDSFFVEIALLLTQRGHAVFFAAGTPADIVRSEVLPEITRRPSVRNLAAPGALRHWASGHRLDIVVANTATAGVLSRLRDIGVPVVYFAHGLHWGSTHDLRTAHWRLIERAALRRTTSAIVLNREDKAWFNAHAPHLDVLWLRCGVGVPLGQFPRSDLPEEPYACWIGEHAPRKRPSAAVAVMAALRDRGAPGHLRILGKGALTDDLAAQIRAGDLAERVSLVGHVPAAEELRRARVLLHTAQWEGLPRVVLEALSVGRPTVAFDVKGLRDLPLVDVVDDGNVSAMADLLINRLTQPIDRSALPRPESLSVEVVVPQIEALLHAVFTSDGPRR